MGFFRAIDGFGEHDYVNYCRTINLDLLELHGSEYVIDHVICEHNQEVKEDTYRNYTSDLLKIIAETLGCTIPHRYDDMIIRPKEEKQEKTGDEIVLEVIKKAGLKVK